MKITAFFRLVVINLFIGACLFDIQAGPIKTIVLDAGHGGHDPGAIGFSKSNEKDVVLDVVLKLGKLIETNYPEIKVLYTRKTDVFVELSKRADIANKNKADLFISIHCNSAPSATAYGTETFVMGVDKTNANMALVQKENSVILKETNYENNYEGFDPYSPESYVIFSLLQNAFLTQSTNFASKVQKNFTQGLNRFDRGVKQAPFLVLWRTTMPSVLIELGFLSNKEEEAYLISEKGKNELSQAIFKAISNTIDNSADIEVVNETVAEKGMDSSIIKGAIQPNKVENRPIEVKKTENREVVVTESKVVETKQLDQKNELEEAPQSGVIYKVQFATVKERKSLDDYAFKGLPDVQCHENGSYYTYTAGMVVTYAEALQVLQKVKEKGYKDAYIIALQNGNRISLDKAKTVTD